MYSDLFLESFDLDPMKLIYESYNFSTWYEDGQHDIGIMFSEASENTTKKNILQKLWSFIRSTFKWISKRFGNFVNWLKSLFTKDKHPRPVDDILEDLGVSGNKTDNDAVVVNIPSNERSSYKPVDVKIMVKPIILKINKDKSLKFTINKVMNSLDISTPIKSHGAVRKNIKGTNYNIHIVRTLCLILQPEMNHKLEDITRDIKNKNFNDAIIKWSSWSLKIFPNDEEKIVTFDKILKFQHTLNSMHKNIECLDISETNIGNDKNTIVFLNDLSDLMGSMQMGINMITGTIHGVYQIDKKYLNCINDIETLSKFVEECIKANIPPKYVANNVYLVTSPSLRGSKGDKDNPIWGQSRLVLFPKNNKKIVYKIALSGWGIRSNKTEYTTTQKFKELGDISLLASTISISKEFTITTAERVNTDRNFNNNEISNFKSIIKQFCINNEINIDYRGDVHPNNVGFANGNMVIIDYAWGNRM